MGDGVEARIDLRVRLPTASYSEEGLLAQGVDLLDQAVELVVLRCAAPGPRGSLTGVFLDSGCRCRRSGSGSPFRCRLPLGLDLFDEPVELVVGEDRHAPKWVLLTHLVAIAVVLDRRRRDAAVEGPVFLDSAVERVVSVSVTLGSMEPSAARSVSFVTLPTAS